MNSQNIFDQFVEFLIRNLVKVVKLIFVFCLIIIAILAFAGYAVLDSFNMVNKSSGLPALPPINVTEGFPTAELGKYPYHSETAMLVYFYSQGSRTERVPSGTTCWGLKLNEYTNTVATYSAETTVTVVQGGCTFYSLTEVYDSIKSSYPSIGWVTMVDNQVVSSP
jgi:hypothetical protein